MQHNPRNGELGGAYEVRKKEKVRWIRGILIICMLLGAGIYYFTKSPLSAIHPAYDPELALPAMDSQGIRVGSEDDLYLIGGLGGPVPMHSEWQHASGQCAAPCGRAWCGRSVFG